MCVRIVNSCELLGHGNKRSESLKCAEFLDQPRDFDIQEIINFGSTKSQVCSWKGRGLFSLQCVCVCSVVGILKQTGVRMCCFITCLFINF